MQSKASDVSSYIDQAPAGRQAALRQLRRLCQEVLQGYEEGMEYGMPCYKRNGVLALSFASQKQHISLYAIKQNVLEEYREALASHSVGKGCVRFQNPDKIDFDLVRGLLQRTAESPAQPC